MKEDLMSALLHVTRVPGAPTTCPLDLTEVLFSSPLRLNILLILIACGLQLMAPWTSPPAVFISPSACLCLLPGASGGWDSRL
ncbi:rCG37207, isoform CRA_a [Rattus norvegicus]|uniref:RCG37207, isoform CRA_a n=1 Tax=Rattus norvegicus TaxID=10116 RepID=A6HUF6_RAT|nr:rCG37207, isoform CRA_a [Rattus norvegicus]